MSGDLQSRLGDIQRPALPPGPMSRGYDTTGTRLTQVTATPAASSSAPSTAAAVASVPDLSQYAGLIAQLMTSLIDAILKKRKFMSSGFTTYVNDPVKLRPAENRGYLGIQNGSTGDMYIGIGYVPTAVTGIKLSAGAYFEPSATPQEEVWIVGSGALAQTGVVLYAGG